MKIWSVKFKRGLDVVGKDDVKIFTDEDKMVGHISWCPSNYIVTIYEQKESVDGEDIHQGYNLKKQRESNLNVILNGEEDIIGHIKRLNEYLTNYIPTKKWFSYKGSHGHYIFLDYEDILNGLHKHSTIPKSYKNFLTRLKQTFLEDLCDTSEYYELLLNVKNFRLNKIKLKGERLENFNVAKLNK